MIAIVVEWDRPCVTEHPDRGETHGPIDVAAFVGDHPDLITDYDGNAASCRPDAVGSVPYQVMISEVRPMPSSRLRCSGRPDCSDEAGGRERTYPAHRRSFDGAGKHHQ